MKTVILVVLATFSLKASAISGTVDGVDYTLTYSDGGNNYVDYTWFFSDPVSAYTMDVVWYGAPPAYTITTTYGSVTQQSTNQYGILYLTISGSIDTSLAGIQYDTNALNFLTMKFYSNSPMQYPSLTFTSLTDPPLTAFSDPPSSAPEPGTIALTALGLFGLALCQRWSKSRRNTLALCALRAPRATEPQPCR